MDKIRLGPRARFARILTSIAAEQGRWLTRAILALSLLGVCQPQWADGLSEKQIKAAYLYNFAKFVEWPADMLSPNAEILLCIVGNNALDGALDGLNGRNVGEHPLRVEQKNYADLSVAGCHLLYIGDSEQAHFLVILTALGNAPTLTLSDIDDFAEKGGGIGLLFRDNKVVFEVNLESIRKAGLHLPSQLLNIASYVYGR
ncbi:MAG: YfiR family protein [Methylomonas sp.]|uniref:YfiR family protein n=1 Tax=Methylomonas sp. TaxID=418 RepID=UPI0025EDEE8E|nr:YfiR family protein [Methylomonas sp.]MCK9608551.1 YfiR family protein [Methylomonas sp.]